MAGRDARFVKIDVVLEGERKDQRARLNYTLLRDQIRTAWKREGRYLIRTNLTETDEREIVRTRYTHPEKDLQLLLDQLKMQLPDQPPPKITRIEPKR